MGAAVYSIATSPNAPNRIYAAVDNGGIGNAGGIWVSDNLGTTWTQRVLGAGQRIRLVRASPTDANLIFVARNRVATWLSRSQYRRRNYVRQPGSGAGRAERR